MGFIMHVVSVVLWYVVVGFGYGFVVDRFDHEWWESEAREASEKADVNYDQFGGFVDICVYIAFAITWPGILKERVVAIFTGGKNG